MPVITFTFGNKSQSYTISAPSSVRLSNWASLAYSTIPNPQAGQVGQPLTIPNPEPILSAIDALWTGIKNNIKSSEKSALQAAISDPTDLG